MKHSISGEDVGRRNTSTGQTYRCFLGKMQRFLKSGTDTRMHTRVHVTRSGLSLWGSQTSRVSPQVDEITMGLSGEPAPALTADKDKETPPLVSGCHSQDRFQSELVGRHAVMSPQPRASACGSGRGPGGAPDRWPMRAASDTPPGKDMGRTEWGQGGGHGVMTE